MKRTPLKIRTRAEVLAGEKVRTLELGAAMIYIATKTRVVLVLDPRKVPPFFKIPGGSIKRTDEGALDAAVWEGSEETGIPLSKSEDEIDIVSTERRTEESYCPYLCTALISEKKLDEKDAENGGTGEWTGDENGHPIRVKIFNRKDVMSIPSLLEKHRHLIQKAEKSLR